ncbi:hypothetical protein [Desnuesiella massiliensis]|uniref:hypothetical protein n=1 Tax=Desnuesiella massiliensis TaxID=1650662 RepID=UPI0006E437B5|nr:hypothetical protein [Desnuesiella massiliensis]
MEIIAKLLLSTVIIGIGFLAYLYSRYPEKMINYRDNGEGETTKLRVQLTRVSGIVILLVCIGLLVKIWF